jgi:hypothetical protein
MWIRFVFQGSRGNPLSLLRTKAFQCPNTVETH